MPTPPDLPTHPGAGPFELGAPGAPRVVLFHGLTGAPSELWPLGLALSAAGYRVEVPLLPGHGTTPDDLARTSADDVLNFARRAGSDPEVAVLGGISMGALLALIVASERTHLDALMLFAPAFEMSGRNRFFVDALGVPPFNWSSASIPKGTPETGEGGTRPVNDGRYDRIPIRWAHELAELQLRAGVAAPKVRCPTLVIHGLLDATAAPAGSLHLAALIGHDVHARFFANSPHVITLGPERGAVAAEAVRFLELTRSSPGSAIL